MAQRVRADSFGVITLTPRARYYRFRRIKGADRHEQFRRLLMHQDSLQRFFEERERRRGLTIGTVRLEKDWYLDKMRSVFYALWDSLEVPDDLRDVVNRKTIDDLDGWKTINFPVLTEEDEWLK